jgi:hypothetical protein
VSLDFLDEKNIFLKEAILTSNTVYRRASSFLLF